MRRGLPLAALAAVLLLPAGAAAAEGEVKALSSGNASELIKKLPITAKAGAEERGVIRIGARRVPRLREGDVLRVGAELQLTNNCVRPEPRCVGPTYRFSPKVKAKLLLRGPGGASRRLGKGREVCGQEEPHREHHCVLVIPPRSRTLRRDDACKRCRIELEVSASHAKANGSQRILIGGNRPDGTIPQDRGRVGGILIRRGAPGARAGTTKRLSRSSSPIDLRPRVVLSKRLRGLRKGEAFEVDARIRESIAHLPYSVRTTAYLIAADGPKATEPKGRIARITQFAGELGESNGFNCPRPDGRCTVRKLGSTQLKRSTRKLWVNLVLFTGPKRANARPGDAAKLSGGRMTVRRYPPPKD